MFIYGLIITYHNHLTDVNSHIIKIDRHYMKTIWA